MEQHEKMAWMLRAILEDIDKRRSHGKTNTTIKKANAMNISRCPHCGVKLGNYLYADACPHCHEELKHNTKPLTPTPKQQPHKAQLWPARFFFGILRLVEA